MSRMPVAPVGLRASDSDSGSWAEDLDRVMCFWRDWPAGEENLK